MMRIVIFLLIPSLLMAMQPAVDYTKVLKDYYSMTDLQTTSYTTVIRRSEDACQRAIAWMNLLYFERARKEFENCGKPEKDFYLSRMKALTSKESAKSYVSLLPDTPEGRMEKLFVKGMALGEVDLTSMRSVLESVNGEKDVYLFEYLYFFRKSDLEKSIEIANEYLRGKKAILVDYDFTLLKKRYYPLILLTARMLYDYAIGGIEDVFKMNIEDFLAMDDKKRGIMVFKEVMFGKSGKRVKDSRLALQAALNLLSYNANDYTFLSKIEDVPDLGILNESFLSFVSRIKKLISILKLD